MIAIQTTPLVLVVVTPVVLMIGALYLAKKARGVPANLSVMIVIFAVVFSMLSGVFGLVVYSSQLRDYRDCRYSVQRSFGSRAYNVELIDVIAANVPQRPDIPIYLRSALDDHLPLRSLSECDELRP